MKNPIFENGKIIRDVVHGDIYIENKFLDIIDSKEFQRLRRIKQLSVANMVFPGADHTRFSHSIGTFYIMGLIIAHFENYLCNIGCERDFSQDEKDIALLAALLHDIGHGPFSHAFEGVLTDVYQKVNHEVWTQRIILDEDSEVHQNIVKNFDSCMPGKIVDLLKHQRIAKKENSKSGIESIELFPILSSLISGQLDADRMDYLLRDSMHCGVPFGKIDIQRIISALQITVYNGKYYVCVPEKYIQDIEAYILARYQMQKVVYYHDFKIEMEQLISKIFSRAHELNRNNMLENVPTAIQNLFSAEEMQLSDYYILDDAVFVYAFSEWVHSKDKVLSELCKSFMFRNKAEKIRILDNCDNDLESFKWDLNQVLSKYKYSVEDFRKEYFWIEHKKSFCAYKCHKENIFILQENGVVVDLTEASKIIKKVGNEDIIWSDDTQVIFMNYEILKRMISCESNQAIEDIHELVKTYDIRNTIEIEKKYIVDSKETFNAVRDYLSNNTNYTITNEGEKEQIDHYYDTKNRIMLKKICTIRIREKAGKYVLTVKSPIIHEDLLLSQSERHEFSQNVEGIRDIDYDYINKHLCFVIENDSLQPTLTVKNYREIVHLQQNGIKFEMVLDNVTYINCNGKQAEDYQIEIELKSEYQHRVNLKVLTDNLEKNVSGLEMIDISKYARGMKMTDM